MAPYREDEKKLRLQHIKPLSDHYSRIFKHNLVANHRTVLYKDQHVNTRQSQAATYNKCSAPKAITLVNSMVTLNYTHHML